MGEWGPAGSAQVSAATQITCAPTNGTDVCITSSPRHDGMMTDAVVKGRGKKKDVAVRVKLGINNFPKRIIARYDGFIWFKSSHWLLLWVEEHI